MQGNFLIGEITALGDTLFVSVAFILLVFLIKKFAWKPIMQVLNERETMINTNIDKSVEARKKAEEMEISVKTQLQSARQEANAVIARAQTEATRVQTSMLNEAREETLRLKKQAAKEIELERMEAIESLRSDIGSMSVDIAEKLLSREINAADQQELIEKFIEGLE